MIEIFYFMFVVYFDYAGVTQKMDMKFDTAEQCFEQVRKVDEDPSVLYFEGKTQILALGRKWSGAQGRGAWY